MQGFTRNFSITCKMKFHHFSSLTIILLVIAPDKGTLGFKLCENQTDIAFMIDNSVSISQDDFDKQILFVQELLKTFDIGPNTIRVSALTFSRKARTKFNFNDIDNSRDAQARIRKISHARLEVTNTNKALKRMRTNLFSSKNGARSDVPKIAILLTDGQSKSNERTLKEANLAKDDGVTIIAIGIGSDVDESELKAIVSSPADRYYFYSSSFDGLKDSLMSQKIVKVLCGGINLCDNPTDIAFMIDNSVSISQEDFDKQILFVQELLKSLNIGPHTIRVSALTFSRKARTKFNFNDIDNSRDAQARIRKITHSRLDVTNTNIALERMRTNLFASKTEARSGVPKIAILLTDGKSKSNERTLKEANLAKDDGVTMIAIGIGSDVDESELKGIVSSPADSYYFHSPTFDGLKDSLMSQKIGKVLCGASPAPPTVSPQDPKIVCQEKKKDVIFVADMSSSIWYQDFLTQLQFLSDLVGVLDINTGNTRVGFLTFSTTTRVQFYLNRYSNADDISKAILAVKSEGGHTNTHLALKKVKSDILTFKHGARDNVDKVVIVITDGRPSMPNLTASEASMLHKDYVEVIVIGVGDNLDIDDLTSIASRPEYIFEMNGGYNTLRGSGMQRNISNILSGNTCKAPPAPSTASSQDPQVVCQEKKKDVIFVADMSSSIWHPDFLTQLQFLSDLVGVLDINTGNTRVGFLTFSTTTRVHFYLNRYSNADDISKAILAVKSEGGQSNTHLALKKVNSDILTFEHGARDNVDQVVIVITDGRPSVPKLTASEASMLHKDYVEVIAIGVGENLNIVDLTSIASRPEYLFEMSGGYNTLRGSDMLRHISNILSRKTCNVIF